MKPTYRQVRQLIPARAVSEGAGVRLFRSLGQSAGTRLDPFLMLDEFVSDNPNDYIAGFPSHPHRGFETVTYMLHGHMLHEDHMGNSGHLRAGDVQWMTAGRGIIHSEMPQQQEGLMHGFQLWINLPGKEKMTPAFYRDAAASEIPKHEVCQGVSIRHIAGTAHYLPSGEESTGFFNGLDQRPRSSDPLFLDISLSPGSQCEIRFASEHQAFCYVYQGKAEIGEHSIPKRHAANLSEGETCLIKSQTETRVLLLAGKPFLEPIAQYGPFVMNTVDEIDQALRDYRDGRLTESS
ncbi:pirin family protein [Spongiibacter sp. KMU-158]|uniref:Pirin family protein n=1 Tax=Spongiibacter pelagi TaxID=2760804 RepID=A0A927GV04_9GAMM|nr:pirin family protein [Spongiibacter pelagi]MBD2857568.1 pirin family protein [Spongiibacter pelagi]